MVTNDLLRKIDKNQLIISQNRPLAQEQVKNLKEYFKIGMTFGYIDTGGQMIISPQYDGAGDFDAGLAVVKQDGKAGYINKTGPSDHSPAV